MRVSFVVTCDRNELDGIVTFLQFFANIDNVFYQGEREEEAAIVCSCDSAESFVDSCCEITKEGFGIYSVERVKVVLS